MATEIVKNKVLGYTEEITACDCCGKTNLKGTYAIETPEGEIKYYGSTCAFKAYNLTTKQLKEGVKAAEAEAVKKARAEYQETEAYKAYTQYIIDREPGLAVAEQTKNEEMRQAIIHESFRLGNLARGAKEAIAKKYGIKYSHKVG